MGSSPSKKSKNLTTQVAAVQKFKNSGRAKSEQLRVEPPDEYSQSARCTSSKRKGNILISFHSNNYAKAQESRIFLQDNGFEVFLVSEGSPVALGPREQSVQWCDVFVIVATFNYQRSPYCVELANYAKDKKKHVVSLLAQPNYSPSGSVGAISLAWGVPVNHLEATKENNKKFLEAIELTEIQPSTVQCCPTLDGEEGSSSQTHKTDGSHVCITFHEDGTDVAGMVRHGTGVSNKGAAANSLFSLPIKMGDPKKDNLQLIRDCKVYIPILTSGYQATAKFQEEYEFARRNQKQIIPVKGEKFWPSGWLSLGIAGKLYYELINSNQAYSAHPTVPDSTPMNDFVYAVLSAMGGESSEEDREKAEIAALTEKLDQLKSKLQEWPPNQRKQDDQRPEPPLPEKLITEDEESLRFNYIKYEVTRMSFNPPKPLFDTNGIPIEQKFDVMLSYQWDIQRYVRNMYMELDMKTFKTWMDIWGGMQGNINEAMATAVENSTLMICFLTEKYQKSVNCNLELMYAKQQKKPILFIRVEPELRLKDWIQEMVDKSLVFDMKSDTEFGVMDRGVPKINRIAEAARNLMKWAATQRKEVRKDVSEEVYKLQNVVEDGLCALAEQENRKRFNVCTRCKAQYENADASGCKRHRAYYMGGTILAGRWVCCSQREKDGIGCENTNHITTPRKWNEMSHEGCFKWNPE